jgi:hypothetical protein
MRLLQKIFQFTRRRGKEATRGVVIIAGGANASITYLLAPFLAAQGQSPVCIDVNDVPPPYFDESGYGTAIIVRYLPPRWSRPLRRFHANGGKLVYFMDDDLMDPAALVGLPPAYAKKIRKLTIKQRSTLEALCSEFWVSSSYLAEKYREWSPKVLTPRPAMTNLLQTSGATVCYHGTASHQAELNWLMPIIKNVQAAKLDTQFEVFGDHSVNKLYRDIPRASILHPMSWSNYLSYTASVRRDIALAPLLPSPFNAARGPTKFFDFARMGAMGIYTDVEPYRGFVRDGEDGLLLPNDPGVWARTIIELVDDEPRRRRMAAAARERAFEMAVDSPDVMNSSRSIVTLSG